MQGNKTPFKLFTNDVFPSRRSGGRPGPTLVPQDFSRRPPVTWNVKHLLLILETLRMEY